MRTIKKDKKERKDRLQVCLDGSAARTCLGYSCLSWTPLEQERRSRRTKRFKLKPIKHSWINRAASCLRGGQFSKPRVRFRVKLDPIYSCYQWRGWSSSEACVYRQTGWAGLFTWYNHLQRNVLLKAWPFHTPCWIQLKGMQTFALLSSFAVGKKGDAPTCRT